MPKYTIEINYSEEIEAKNEKEAQDKFINDVIYAPQSDFASFVMDNLEIEEKDKCFACGKKQDEDGRCKCTNKDGK